MDDVTVDFVGWDVFPKDQNSQNANLGSKCLRRCKINSIKQEMLGFFLSGFLASWL